MLILRSDQIAKSAVMKATEDELTNSFWAILESGFSEPFILKGIDMRGRVGKVNSITMPRNFRNASKLKNVLMNARSDFTKAKERCLRSCQNNPQRFPQFLSYQKNVEMSQLSKRVYVIFTTDGLDTESPYDSF